MHLENLCVNCKQDFEPYNEVFRNPETDWRDLVNMCELSNVNIR